MIEPAITIEGADEIRKSFKAAGGATKDLSKAHRLVSKIVERKGRTNAKSASRQQAKAATVLLGKGSAGAAAIAIRATSKAPYGIGAFMGARRFRQFPAWVGEGWDVMAGDGPYVVAPTIADNRDEILNQFSESVGEVMKSVGLEMDLK